MKAVENNNSKGCLKYSPIVFHEYSKLQHYLYSYVLSNREKCKGQMLFSEETNWSTEVYMTVFENVPTEFSFLKPKLH